MSPEEPEITPPSTSVDADWSTVTVVKAGKSMGTSNSFEVDVPDESIEVNAAVLLLLAEIE